MSRPSPSPQARSFAWQIFACEIAVTGPSQAHLPPVFRVFEKLRDSFSRLVGPAGFRVLLARALTLAKRQHPLLDGLELTPDGALEGFRDEGGGETAEAGHILLAELLGLLIMFIGESLAFNLLRDVWPDLQQAATIEERATET